MMKIIYNFFFNCCCICMETSLPAVVAYVNNMLCSFSMVKICTDLCVSARDVVDKINAIKICLKNINK